jgi:thioredoxin reductase
VNGVLVTIGHDPGGELRKSQIEMNDEGWAKVDARSARTTIPRRVHGR